MAALSALTAKVSEIRTLEKRQTSSIIKPASLQTSSKSATMKYYCNRAGHAAALMYTFVIRRSLVVSAISTKCLYVNSK